MKQILTHKQTGLITVDRHDSVETAVRLLADHNIGTLLVVDEAGRLIGMLSERDIIRRCAANGASVFSEDVRDVMRPEVLTCEPNDSIEKIMRQMTWQRARHLPVLDDGHLRGVISIGDVMKCRLDEIQTEADVLRDRLLGRLGNSRFNSR